MFRAPYATKNSKVHNATLKTGFSFKKKKSYLMHTYSVLRLFNSLNVQTYLIFFITTICNKANVSFTPISKRQLKQREASQFSVLQPQ